MKRTIKRAAIVIAVLLSPAALVAVATLVPMIGWAVFPGVVLWQMATHPRKKEEARRRQQQEQAEVLELVRLHLIAHGLPDTPANRARVLQGLARPTARRGQR